MAAGDTTVGSTPDWFDEEVIAGHQRRGKRVCLVTAGSGGSNGVRVRLWKLVVQESAEATGLRNKVCHLPPGTSEWNKVEHRMFCHITENWRGMPLLSREVIVNLIGGTRTEMGLRGEAALDTNSYPKGIEVSDEEMAGVRIKRDKFRGDWDYTISPRKG